RLVTPRLRRMLERRLAAYIKSWPPTIGRDLSMYSEARRRPASGRRSARRDRYWTSLPVWLLKHPRFAAPRRGGHAFLEDILWGQYCLFLFVRIHDDLFDRQAQSPALLFMADGLLVESRRS